MNKLGFLTPQDLYYVKKAKLEANADMLKF